MPPLQFFFHEIQPSVQLHNENYKLSKKSSALASIHRTLFVQHSRAALVRLVRPPCLVDEIDSDPQRIPKHYLRTHRHALFSRLNSPRSFLAFSSLRAEPVIMLERRYLGAKDTAIGIGNESPWWKKALQTVYCIALVSSCLCTWSEWEKTGRLAGFNLGSPVNSPPVNSFLFWVSVRIDRNETFVFVSLWRKPLLLYNTPES